MAVTFFEGDAMNDFAKQLQNYRLTTAEILYHYPDHPLLLQSYTWQELDICPTFPILNQFLTFWERELDGRLHSVNIASVEIITPGEMQFLDGEVTIH